MTSTLDDYLSTRPDLVPYVPFMHPDRARALGFDNPFLIFPPHFFDDHSAYDQECQRNTHANNVMLKSLGLFQGDVETFLHGIVWTLQTTDRRVKEERRNAAAKTHEAKKMEKQKRLIERRETKKAETRERIVARCASVTSNKRMSCVTSPLSTTTPWESGTHPAGLLTFPDTQKPVLVQHLPESVVDTLMDVVDEVLTRYGDQDPDTDEQMYVHVGRYRARYGSTIFSGWQVQRRIPGASTVYLGRTWESILGAIIAAASYMDARITTLASAHSWVLWLVEGGEVSATTWLTSVRYALENWRANIKVRAQGGGRRHS